ncbi:GNAT family N-acetyltransferase [Allokutzneria sp. NRRL B-24872]|uniref:GNAT family N-acetyltransferase n=1 Tax=Allokutzneria sp. NRRL B-24872 TaxID=1137961 RepID=UPI00143D479D|nr:GNAT family N-acetyltransferase [Allokutzneria sp. NRRL B-24872]
MLEDAVTTARLILRMPTQADSQEVFDLYADRRVWESDPVSRHRTIDQTERMIENWRSAWHRDGLGMWIARSHQGVFVGIGGCFVRYGVAWNVGFRLEPRWWGAGYAQEISAAARGAAQRLRPELPLTAYVLDGNEQSRRAVERLGLAFAWRGPDAGNPDLSAVRLLYSDRPLSQDVLRALTER